MLNKTAIASAGLAGVLVIGSVHAAHPMITEDTGTQGAGGFQLELTYDDNHDRIGETKTRSTVAASVLSYGIADNLDIALGLAHTRNEATESNVTHVESGGGDSQLSVKWRFHENGNLSFALKPSLTLPSGNAARGLGSGRSTYGLDFIASLEQNLLAYHFHAGYLRNLNSVDEREDIFHLSGAVVYHANDKLKLVADAGINTNTDIFSRSWPATLVSGVIYSPRKELDLDAGIHVGLNRAATDYAFLSGVTIRW